MENLFKWITLNPITTAIIVIILISIGVWIFVNRRGLIYKAALYAVSEAEYAWGSSTGKIKFAEVYTYIKKEFPLITFFLTEKQLTDIIENALLEMKRILAYKQSKLEKQENKNK